MTSCVCSLQYTIDDTYNVKTQKVKHKIKSSAQLSHGVEGGENFFDPHLLLMKQNIAHMFHYYDV